MSDQKRILWADDEIDLLRPHILFLEGKGYSVTGVTNGDDAVSLVAQESFDAVLLDENMPGRGGLDALNGIQEHRPGIPVVMITKSEEEHIMNEAIGQRIRDYLIKPVNPSQIYLALKKIFESENIQKSTLTRDFVRDLRGLTTDVSSAREVEDWYRIADRIARWDIDMADVSDPGLRQSHLDQKREANSQFGRFIEKNYPEWVKTSDRPVLSTDLVGKYVAPLLKAGERVALVLIDCMRLDQWMAIRHHLQPHFDIQQDLYISILPTATPYSRNSIFAGLFPREIKAHHPEYWDESLESDGSRNRYEQEMLAANLERCGLKVPAWKYQKVFTTAEGAALKRQASTFGTLDFVALVFNFMDILAHGRSDSHILQELAPDEDAFRTLLEAWFARSTLLDILVLMAEQGMHVILTTDHGSVLVNRATMVHASRETSSNLRYKFGPNLRVEGKGAVRVKNPAEYGLPSDRPTKTYIFAKDSNYFVYPNNFHQYERQFRNTFQHGGISIDEMVLPCVHLKPRA